MLSQKLLFIYVLLFFSIGPVSVYAGDNEALSDVQIASIRDDLGLWNMAETQVSLELKEKLARSIIRKVMLIRSVSPNLKQLGGESLETLCLLSELDPIFKVNKNDKVAGVAERYIMSLSGDVKSNIKGNYSPHQA